MNKNYKHEIVAGGLTLREKELDNQAKLIEQWDGQLPQVEGSDSIINLPNLK